MADSKNKVYVLWLCSFLIKKLHLMRKQMLFTKFTYKIFFPLKNSVVEDFQPLLLLVFTLSVLISLCVF